MIHDYNFVKLYNFLIFIILKKVLISLFNFYLAETVLCFVLWMIFKNDNFTESIIKSF